MQFVYIYMYILGTRVRFIEDRVSAMQTDNE